MQGYKENEYEVLDQSEDIDYISDKEIELQKSYGYKVDRKLYKNLFNKMKINATEQTSTFPVPVNKLKGRLLDNIGLKWKTTFGQFEITKESVKWIMTNVKESMYNSKTGHMFIIKLFTKHLIIHSITLIANQYDTSVDKVPGRFDLIRVWAQERGLYDKGNSHTQYVKLQEEAGELAQAILKQDKPEIQDAIGDMVVVLTNLAHLEGFSVEDCIDSAYTEIAMRKGKMLNGTFVKETL
jgi:NTP pyrophosphatase (non-canonical NTP hydrolase)